MEKQLLEFLNQYFGKENVGDTPENKGQCTGLCELWLDQLGVNQNHLYGDAKDLLTNADPNKFTKIYNDISDYNQFPPIGAVIIFNSGFVLGNVAGHCGIVLRANGYSFSLFESNNPLGARPTITNYNNYLGVQGWLQARI